MVADIDGDSAAVVAAEIRDAGGAADACLVDIGDIAQVAAMVDATVARFGGLDILVNNAGIGHAGLVLDITPEEWDRVIRVNLTGTFYCAQAAAKHMVARESGRIVNVASISGQRGGSGRAAYGAAKAGVEMLTKVMAVELAEHGVRVNAVAPGPVDTPQSRATHNPATREAYLRLLPTHRYGEAREIADAVVFLASDAASWVHGHTLNVDGGFGAAGLIVSLGER
jgi:3-oxoacyl-[acyl-carrier protein] reductase